MQRPFKLQTQMIKFIDWLIEIEIIEESSQWINRDEVPEPY